MIIMHYSLCCRIMFYYIDILILILTSVWFPLHLQIGQKIITFKISFLFHLLHNLNEHKVCLIFNVKLVSLLKFIMMESSAWVNHLQLWIIRNNYYTQIPKVKKLHYALVYRSMTRKQHKETHFRDHVTSPYGNIKLLLFCIFFIFLNVMLIQILIHIAKHC